LLHWVAVFRTAHLPSVVELAGYGLLTVFGVCSSLVLVRSVQFLSASGSRYVFQKEATKEKYFTAANEDSQIEYTEGEVTQVDPVEKEKKIEATDGYEI
jgi:hypothetical protein